MLSAGSSSATPVLDSVSDDPGDLGEHAVARNMKTLISESAARLTRLFDDVFSDAFVCMAKPTLAVVS
jgi:hypothetical protein